VLAIPSLKGGNSLKKTYANDTLGANQLDQLVRVASLSIALAVGLEVAQVTDVALVIFGGAVGLVVRVDFRKCVSCQIQYHTNPSSRIMCDVQ
jgi:hypothetical protein